MAAPAPGRNLLGKLLPADVRRRGERRRTATVPTRWPRTTTGATDCESSVPKQASWRRGGRALSRICTSAPVRAARSRIGDRSADAQLPPRRPP